MSCKYSMLLSRRFSNKSLTTSKSDNKFFDIIISGGGLVGSTLACILSKNPMLKNRKILLIEGAKKKEWQLSKNYSNRVTALNTSTKNLFEINDIWKHIADQRFQPVRQMKVWGVGSDAAIEFEQNKYLKSSTKNVAYIVENDVILSALDRELDKSEYSVTIMYGSRVHSYEFPIISESQQQVTVVMDDGNKFNCSLLLGTDGANSKVREKMGVEHLTWDYHQSGIVATLELDEAGENDTAWQRFLTTGPVALLPLNKNMSSLVWSAKSDVAEQLLRLPDDEFVKALNTAFTESPKNNVLIDCASKLTDLMMQSLNVNASSKSTALRPPLVKAIQGGSRAAFPLGFGHASSYVRPGVALLGDAAHRVHPLAGQGVNLGFGDIECFNRIIGETVSNGLPIDSYSSLKLYEKERLLHNLPTMIAIDLMNRVYSSSNSALVTVGHLALQFTNRVTPLRQLMIKQASL